MAGLGDLLGTLGGGSLGGGFIGTIGSILIGVTAFGIVLFAVIMFFKKRKNWNMKVEFRIPRDVSQSEDGSIKGNINKEWGKGYYNPKRGVVYIKRKGKKAVAMQPFDIKRFLSKSNILTVIQIGIEDYKPIIEESYLEVRDDQTGEEGALLHTKIDTSHGLAWQTTFEREAKATYSIQNFLQQHGDKLVWGLIIMIILIGQAIVITRLQ